MKTAPYGSWPSPITSDLIVAQSVGLSEIRLDGGNIYWLESRPYEAGRSVVVSQSTGKDLVPPPFNVRTKVHEYGGGAWTVSDGTLYFSNFADQRLYSLKPGASEPQPLTDAGPMRYADGVIDSVDGKPAAWVGVREDHSVASREPENTLVRIDANGVRILASGHDFYSSPRLSPALPSGSRWLAYLAWDHPRMPWVGTALYVVELSEDGMPAGEPLVIAGGEKESVLQPEWALESSDLFFISDRTGWWNIYRYAWRTEKIDAVAPMEAEFGQAQWVFGMSTYGFAGPGRLVCAYASKGLGHLAVIDLRSGALHSSRTPLH